MTSFTSSSYSTTYMEFPEDRFTNPDFQPYSYMYNKEGDDFLFPDEELKDSSLLPPSQIQRELVIYTLDPNCEPAVYFKNKFIKQLDVFCKKVPSRDKEALYAIAQAAIFIITGKRDQVIPESVVEEEGVDLYFCVEDEEHTPHQIKIHNYPSSDSSIEEYTSSEDGSPLLSRRRYSSEDEKYLDHEES